MCVVDNEILRTLNRGPARSERQKISVTIRMYVMLNEELDIEIRAGFEPVSLYIRKEACMIIGTVCCTCVTRAP